MNLTQVCRMCLCVKMGLVNFDTLENIYQDKTITDVLNYIFDKKFLINDDEPKYICDTCIMKCVETYIFLSRCINSHKYIAKYIENNTKLNPKIKTFNSKHRFKKIKINAECEIETTSNEDQDLSENEFLGFEDSMEEDGLYEANFNSEQELDNKYSIENEDMRHEDIENIVIIVDKDESNEITMCNEDSNITDLEEDKKDEKNCDNNLDNESFDTIDKEFSIENTEENNIEEDSENSETETEDLIEDSETFIFKCNKCNKSFKNKYILKAHMRRHEQQGQFICTTCGKAFNSQGCLTRHVNIHTGNNRYKCEICNKLFPSSNNLILHSRIHSGVKPYLCTICGRSFSHVTSLTYHMRTHTNERPFQCHICGKQFTIQCHFDRHKKTHTGERPFQCDKCGKGFIKKFDLQRHEAIHNSDRPFKCTFCKKSFIRRLPLKLHMMVHTKERPHKCEFCGRGFIRAYYLKDHIAKVHLNEDIKTT